MAVVMPRHGKGHGCRCDHILLSVLLYIHSVLKV
jgi:hypothetical protein